jgi:MtN3 and saliva related transmembrane protein
MELFTKFIDVIFGAGLIINALLFIPQAIRILKSKHAEDLSLTTFIGFCLTQLSTIIYGFLHKDYILAYGYIFALATCGTVTGLGIYYRLFKTKHVRL